ncbi:EamA family transporter [Patescibacteria group bacterium]|nr:EamA family transporter [Patescibacteria group bacterium]
MNQWHIWLLLYILIAGINSFIVRFTGKNLSWQTNMFFVHAPGWVILSLLAYRHAKIEINKYTLIALGLGIISSFAIIFSYKIVQKIDASVFAPLFTLSIIVTAILGIVFLKEPITIQKGIGICAGITCAILLTR